MEKHEEYRVQGKSEIRFACTVPISNLVYQPPKPEEIREALRRADLTGAVAGRLLGVDGRTIRKWTGGERDIPYSAWRLLLIETGLAKAGDGLDAVIQKS